MKAMFKRALPALLLASCAFSAQAGVTTLGSVEKNYGSAAGRDGAGLNTFKGCDKLAAGSLSVTDKIGCNRFRDVFDFSSMDYTNIDSFDLTLTFSKTDDFTTLFGRKYFEEWSVGIAESATVKSETLLDMVNSTGAYTQTFNINATSHSDVFANIVKNGKLELWFYDNSAYTADFNLIDASLAVNVAEAADVPEPTGMALFGVAMLGAAVARRRRAAK